MPPPIIPKKNKKKTHDMKVQPRDVKEGDLVLRKIMPLSNKDHSKQASNYEGPYVVKKGIFIRSIVVDLYG